MIRLAVLIDRLERAGLVQAIEGPVQDIQIDRTANDSRKVGPNSLFVAIRGAEADGHLFFDKAVQNGAVAVVCEVMPVERSSSFTGIALVQVSNSRAALAELAAELNGDPSRQLTMVGITGTNGKTTTTYLVHHLFRSLGVMSGLIGTVAVQIGDTPIDATHTTPDALELNQLLRRMVDAECQACVMEVSSHALHQDRVRAIAFDVAVYTNLTRDHLDYHKTLEQYFEAKKILFDQLSTDAVALFNADDPSGFKIVARTRAQVYSYGYDGKATYRVEVLENRLEGLKLRIDGVERTFRLVGLFNAHNLTAAYGVGRVLGYGRDEVLDALATAPPVPGRFEQIRCADGTTVVIDYAHTPDALQNVLHSIRETKPETATLWCVFGCGGDRDRSKRRFMGSIAERYADRIVVTSDNPRTDDPEKIMNDIRRGMDHPDEVMWIVNRREAIRRVAEQVSPGDVVLIAGKGHENYQIIGKQKLPFDDRLEVKSSFAFRGILQEGNP